MGTLPAALVAEVRLAFRSCSRQYAASRRTRFSSLHNPRLNREDPGKNKNDNLPIQVVHSRLQTPPKPKPPAPSLPKHGPESTELVTAPNEGKAVESGRKVPVPMRVIPKAEIAPNLTLSPKERLHIEQLTRRLPPRAEPKGTYPCCVL